MNELNNQPLVSVILPVFNGALFVEQAILSIQNQTLHDWELIIWDDGSRDCSRKLCQKISLKDSRIKVFGDQENKGLAYAMNQLSEASQGKYIAIQEQDDLSVPERLQREVEVLDSKSEIGLVSGIAEWIDETGRTLNFFPGLLRQKKQYPQNRQEMVRLLYLEQCKVVNAACMFRRSALYSGRPFDEGFRVSIDWQFFLHIAHHHLIWGIPEVLVHMRRGRGHVSLTSNKNLQFREARRCVCLVYKKYKDNSRSPINFGLLLKALASESVLEGRYYGGFLGLSFLLQALLLNPLNKFAWKSLNELLLRGLRKVYAL